MTLGLSTLSDPASSAQPGTVKNLAGADIDSANTIVEQWQNIDVGDVVHLAAEVAVTVAVIEPQQAVVLHAGTSIGPMPAPYEGATLKL